MCQKGLALAVGLVVTSVVMPTVQADAASAQDLATWVNPFVGTRPGGEDQGTGGGAGNTFPGAVVPFGMVQWSPDTVEEQHGGYFYDSTALKGFSLTHLSGAGCDTYEDIPFIPYAGEVSTSPATDPGRYTMPFSHANEQATAGKYSVKLDSGVNVDLTATQRTGSGRFTYPQNGPSTLLINSSGSIMGTDDAQITIGEDSVSGCASSGRFCGTDSHYRVYFHAKFDTPFASIGTWRNGTVAPADTTVSGPGSGPGSGGYVTFAPGATVNVQVGVSFVSIEGARENLKAENNHRPFDDVATAARKAWNDRLNQIQVTGGTDADKITFYTALYHSLIQPNVFSDADGRYLGFDGRVHTADKGHAMYTNFSGWDIYRSEIQLLAMLAPNETSDMARSMIAYAAQGGAWDRWTVANDYTGVMNGDPYHIIVSSAYAFGAKDFDANDALQSMLRGATWPTIQGYPERPGLADYQKLGYVPGAGADTLEYTSADFSIAQLAQRLGDISTYQNFMRRAQYWQNLFNPATGYLQPRQADGTFTTPYHPGSSSGWVEGNGAQYSWMVPYDPAGLIAAFGGNQAAQSRLDEFFTELNAGTQDPHAFMGNEPNANAPWLYDFAGAPYKTQAIVRRSMTELYNPNPEGLAGNDDLGQMSSWYVWSALGMYPEIPGRSELVLGSPLFSKTVLTTGAGTTITINSDGGGQYVTGLKVNGTTTTKPWLPESFVANGGTLDYTLSSAPDTSWGSAPSDAPPSFREGELPALSFVDPARVVVPDGAGGAAAVGAKSAAGQPSPSATLGVLVAQNGSWLATVNNAGISPDANPAAANFDGVGFSYSSDALAAAGARAGGTVTVNGLSYSWPNYPAGWPDNVIAQGQTVNLAGSGRLAFLGAAANGDASGTVTITYTDGSTSTASLGFSDWTLGAGAARPGFGNEVAFTTPYRNSGGGDPQQINTYVFASAPIALAAGKTVKGVTWASTVSGGQLHVFAIGMGA